MGSQRVYLAIEPEQQQIRHMDGNKSISLDSVFHFYFPLGHLIQILSCKFKEKMPETVIFSQSHLFSKIHLFL